MWKQLFCARAVATIALLWCGSAFAQLPKSARLFEQSCLACHGCTQDGSLPDATALRQMTPESIVQAIGSGTAHEPARQLSESNKRAIGEFLSGRNFMPDNAGDAASMPNR